MKSATLKKLIIDLQKLIEDEYLDAKVLMTEEEQELVIYYSILKY